MVLVRYSFCNALSSLLPSLFYLFSDTPGTTTTLMQLNMIFATPKILTSKTNYQFHVVSGTQFVILRFQVLIVLYYLIASQFLRVTDIMSGIYIYNLKREQLVNDKYRYY